VRNRLWVMTVFSSYARVSTRRRFAYGKVLTHRVRPSSSVSVERDETRVTPYRFP
jgi:hypothetical protein